MQEKTLPDEQCKPGESQLRKRAARKNYVEVSGLVRLILIILFVTKRLV